METGNFVYLECISEFVLKVFICQLHPEIQASTIETKVFSVFSSVGSKKPNASFYLFFRFVALLMLPVEIKSVKEMSRGTKDFGKSQY